MEDDELPLERMEQGTLQDCTYCSRVRPDVGGACPFCRGEGGGFRPARMMTPDLARSEVLRLLFEGGDPRRAVDDAPDEDARRRAAEEARARLVRLLADVRLHGFDLEQALVEAVWEVEVRAGIADPPEG